MTPPLAAGNVTAAASTLRHHAGVGYHGGSGPGYVFQAETAGVRIGTDLAARTEAHAHVADRRRPPTRRRRSTVLMRARLAALTRSTHRALRWVLTARPGASRWR